MQRTVATERKLTRKQNRCNKSKCIVYNEKDQKSKCVLITEDLKPRPEI